MTAGRQTHASSGAIRRVRSAMAPRAKTMLLRTGAYAALRRVLPSRRVAILRYHAICNDEGYAYADPSICISPAAFDAHVRYLAANYNVLALGEIVAGLTSGRSLPANTVAITFDDGYADNLEAARTLHRHGVSGTFFITAGCLRGGDPFWLSEVRQLVMAVPDGTIALRAGSASAELHVSDAASRAKAIRAVTSLIKTQPIAGREQIREQLRAAAGRTTDNRWMLDWNELAEMHRLGMTIGAHTMTHPNLPSAGLADATSEIVESKARLERELGTPVTLFSYPNGGAERYFTPALQDVVRQSGYAAALTSRNGFADAKSDPYALERIEVEERLEDLVFALEVERFAFAPSS